MISLTILEYIGKTQYYNGPCSTACTNLLAGGGSSGDDNQLNALMRDMKSFDMNCLFCHISIE